MNPEDLYRRMYGPSAGNQPTQKQTSPRDKLASRVLGGMKAQNSHTKVVEFDGELVTLPRAEYIKVLEDQIRQMRATVRELENKYSRSLRSVAKVQEDIRRLEQELRNKVDLR